MKNAYEERAEIMAILSLVIDRSGGFVEVEKAVLQLRLQESCGKFLITETADRRSWRVHYERPNIQVVEVTQGTEEVHLVRDGVVVSKMVVEP